MTIAPFPDSRLMFFAQQPLEATLLVKDESFDNTKISSYQLCIEIGKNRFRFMIVDETKRCLWLEDYSLNSLIGKPQLMQSVAKLYEQHPFLGNTAWKNVIVSFNSSDFTLVPEDFFRKEYISQYLQLMRGNTLRADEVALSHAIETLKARNAFIANKAVHEWILNTYAPHTPTFVHQTSTLIQEAMRLSSKQAHLLCYFEDEYLSIAIAKGGKLLLCNKFHYTNAQDMGYYVLVAITNLKLKPSEVACLLFGEITPYSDDYQWLQKFLPNLSLGNCLQGIRLGEAFDDLPEHRYFSLYGIFSA